MSLVDKMLANSVQQYADAAANAGATLTEHVVVEVGEQGVISFLKESLSLGVLQQVDVSPTHLAIYQLTTDVWHLLHVVPSRKFDALPAEVHVRVSGALRTAVSFNWGGLLRKNKWRADDDSELEQRLHASAELASATKKLSWKKSLPVARVNLDWTLQLRSLGDGTSHLVFQAGNYGLAGQRTGLAEFLAVVAALEPLLDAAEHPAQVLPWSDRYSALFEQLMLG